MQDKIKILIVDDEQIVLDSIKKHLRSEEHLEVLDVLNVAAAMEQVRSNDIRIILTDLMMPEIDGLEFIKLVKEIDPTVIMVMITGYATINTALQAMQLGAFDYLAKPFTRDELKKVIKRASDLALSFPDKNDDSKQESIEHLEMKSAIKGIGEHSWMVMQDDGCVLIGVERPFLINVGRIQTVYLPSEGDEIRQGSTYFQVFSSDLRAQSLLSPLSGTVLEVNEKVINDPNQTLQDPYDEGWLIKLRPSNYNEELKLMGL